MAKKGKGKGKKGKNKGPPGPDPRVLPIALRDALINCDIATVEAWLNGGGFVDATHGNPALLDRGRTLLHLASRNGQEFFIHMLLQRRASVNAQDPNGTTPLMFASSNGNPEAVRRLLWHGADPHMTNGAGHGPIQWAKARGHADEDMGARGHTECIRLITDHIKAHSEAPLRIAPGPGIWAGM
mmetsp:Transcript_34839/g.69480  ORF Transcript_34839/g.69480 Transcript_34839/m.69480 type:complete len:184 (-) Transcript_34839:222-773(-)|eukprot:CAMPEP_0174723632 /NCGR_PEP_ID=MMETSP1094-20130205/41463_1 /TAXON_ID=156173 /ORGANISM="Chrysochromulina brevifilum, Strain UTEX LB 985" /LENGTH=183 /DNA_ID=CAMNT_0015924709 /DNA_START=124 /DNA_END=675 /DNA_ORIENTATION=+